MAIAVERGCVKIVHRDEHVIFELGGESLWESTLHRDSWSVRKIRRMDYEGADSSAAVAQIELKLPNTIRPPNLALTVAPSAQHLSPAPPAQRG
jgi:hypothetical protein